MSRDGMFSYDDFSIGYPLTQYEREFVFGAPSSPDRFLEFTTLPGASAQAQAFADSANEKFSDLVAEGFYDRSRPEPDYYTIPVNLTDVMRAEEDARRWDQAKAMGDEYSGDAIADLAFQQMDELGLIFPSLVEIGLTGLKKVGSPIWKFFSVPRKPLSPAERAYIRSVARDVASDAASKNYKAVRSSDAEPVVDLNYLASQAEKQPVRTIESLGDVFRGQPVQPQVQSIPVQPQPSLEDLGRSWLRDYDEIATRPAQTRAASNRRFVRRVPRKQLLSPDEVEQLKRAGRLVPDVWE